MFSGGKLLALSTADCATVGVDFVADYADHASFVSSLSDIVDPSGHIVKTVTIGDIKNHKRSNSIFIMTVQNL